MSLIFNDPTNYRGIVQQYEKEIGATRGDVSGNNDLLKELAASVNLALDDFVRIAIQASGLWQYDDSNQTDYPIITTNLVSGQRDYSFTTDGSGNLILDIYKVFVADTNGTFQELRPVDVETSRRWLLSSFTNGLNASGIPSKYDKMANALFVDPIPNYNSAGGLKAYVNREGSYFAYNDTTKKPGVPGLFHKYFALRPAEDYARRNALTTYPTIRAERIQMEADIKDYFSHRDKDVRASITIKGIKFI